MGMTINEAIWHLDTYSSTNGSGQTTEEQHEEAKKIAKETMRKYLKIEEIYYHQSGCALEDSLRAVIENEFDCSVRAEKETNSSMKYAISRDGESFFITFPTREDAIQVGSNEYANQEEFYIGEMYEPEVEFLHEESIAEEIIDEIKHDLYDEDYEEALESFVVEDEKYYKLAERIKAAVDKWIKDEGIKAGFSVVRNVEKVRRANIYSCSEKIRGTNEDKDTKQEQ